MTKSDRARPPPDDSPDKSPAVWPLWLLSPLPCALAGAAVGFHLYFRQPGLNTDTAAPLMFASLWALGGMMCGAFCTGSAAWMIESAMRRVSPAHPLITGSLTIAILIGLCVGLYAPLEARLPGLLWPRLKPTPPRPPVKDQASPCRQPPPIDRQARQAWELECR